MKIVLRSCFKRRYENPMESDDALVQRSLVAVILPILRSTDVANFNEIMKDLFPSVESLNSNNARLRQAFNEWCSSKQLQPIDRLYEKLVETYETMATRHALMLIGDPWTGKSTILRILRKALAASDGDSEMDIGKPKKVEIFFKCIDLEAQTLFQNT